MTRVTGKDHNCAVGFGQVVDDEVGVAGVGEPTQCLLHKRTVGEVWQGLAEKFAHLALILRRNEALDTFGCLRDTGLGVGVNEATAHGAELEKVGLWVRLEEETEITGICDWDAPKRCGLLVC